MDNNVTGTAQRQEAAAKRAKIRSFMERNGLDALVLARQNDFAWATGGGSNLVNVAAEQGAASLVFTKGDKAYTVLDNIEGPRFEFEEGMRELGFEMAPRPWWSNGEEKRRHLLDLVGGDSAKIGADHAMEGARDIYAALKRERWSLVPEERERYYEVGRLAAESLEEVARGVTPGLSEHEIAGRMAEACYGRGLVPFVLLVAADERVWKYRHPLHTGKKLEKYVMMVLCARKGGLIANITRQVHFGPLEAELSRKHAAVQRVDATMNLATKPGAEVKNIFALMMERYRQEGFPDEWHLHHQGGATGYDGREYFATPSIEETVQDWQAFAWNPSITGTKCEDTILTSREKGVEVLTTSPDSAWPKTRVEIDGLGSLPRPDILVL